MQPRDGSAAAPAAARAALAPSIRTKAGAELRLLGPATLHDGQPAARVGTARKRVAACRSNCGAASTSGTREVTNGEFKQFQPQHRSGFVGQNSLELDRQPVVNVTWQDAAEYCNWLSQQEGLPPAYQSQGGKLVPVQPVTTGYRLADRSRMGMGGARESRRQPAQVSVG